MARGAIGKTEVIARIAQAFGDDFIGEVDKKVYIWANDGNERVQIALALTCPKNPVDVPDKNPVQKTEDWDFSEDVVTNATPTTRATITDEEKQRVADLMKNLGL